MMKAISIPMAERTKQTSLMIISAIRSYSIDYRGARSATVTVLQILSDESCNLAWAAWL